MTLTERIKERFPGALVAEHSFRGDETVEVKPEALWELAKYLRDEAGFDVLTDLAGVDGLHLGWERRFQVVYHFSGYAPRRARRLRVKVSLPESAPQVVSLAKLFKSADWLERECWDQYGISFEGHSNLVRILNHEEFVGHPLRKDYPVDGRHILHRATDLD